ncbi:MAG: hypothetical protein KJ077_10420 [Anaerolineae bacterium]|nr:hypothetical protein [Anaerolineae bacterium]
METTISYFKIPAWPVDISYKSGEQKTSSFQRKTEKRHLIPIVSSKSDHTLSINLVTQTPEGIPIELVDILRAIEQSRYILELEDDWDTEGSKGYQPLAWERVAIFLIKLYQKALESFAVILDTPRIYHAHGGSIDVLWRSDRYQLLVNFPEDENSSASFYGDNFNIETIKGTFDPTEESCGLLAFLVWAKKCIG